MKALMTKVAARMKSTVAGGPMPSKNLKEMKRKAMMGDATKLRSKGSLSRKAMGPHLAARGKAKALAKKPSIGSQIGKGLSRLKNKIF